MAVVLPPDGRFLAYTEFHPQSGMDIWMVRLDDRSSRRPERFLGTPFQEDLPVFSPDGRWIAYRSNESGRLEMCGAQFPGAAVKQQISVDGGDQPLRAPRLLQLRSTAASGDTYVVFPDGKRFLFVEQPVQPEVHELRVELNWFEELKARVPTK